MAYMALAYTLRVLVLACSQLGHHISWGARVTVVPTVTQLRSTPFQWPSLVYTYTVLYIVNLVYDCMWLFLWKKGMANCWAWTCLEKAYLCSLRLHFAAFRTLLGVCGDMEWTLFPGDGRVICFVQSWLTLFSLL